MFKNLGKDLVKAFNTGVSYFLPAVVIGGVFLAFALATGEAGSDGMKDVYKRQAIASGVEEGVVDVYAISTFTDKRMLIELNLELKVNKNKKQLQSPLFFTMQVPEGWNPLYLYHRHEDGSVEQLEYMREGNTVKVRMDRCV